MPTLVFKKMSAIIWFLFSVWTIECSNEVVTNRDRCPRSCCCNHVKRAVLCLRRGLTMIPESLPKDTAQLKLNGNILIGQTISRMNMTSHKSLEQLFISGCGIKKIGVDAFVDLVNLRWLDLSDNRLSVLQENSFRGLRLQHLFLNGNQDLQLQPTSFVGLVTTGLYLHNCSSTVLFLEVLIPLNGSLVNLWFNGQTLGRPVEPDMARFLSTLSTTCFVV